MSMKENIFKLYAFFFNMGAAAPMKKKRVTLISMHNANFTDSLGEIDALLDGYNVLKISRTALASPVSALKFCTVDAFKTGRSRYIFLNDNFMALGYTKPKKATEIVQLWHGQGAFKKFGFDIEQPEEIRERERALSKRISHVVCSSEGVKDIYAGAFGVSEDRVITTGTPNEDYYFRITDEEKEELRKSFDEKYPRCKGKKLILYAPTFRDDKTLDERLLKWIDCQKLKASAEKSLGGEVEVLIRLHPQVHSKVEESNDFVDVTEYPNVNELCVLADVLITDYSSICMDFSLQNKPMVFYAYDLFLYKGARDFYFDYESYVPGPVAKTMDELSKIFDVGEFLMSKNAAFRVQNFGNPSGNATRELLLRLGIKVKK